GKYTFSSDRAARLAAILLEEQVGGRQVTPNALLWLLDAPRTSEKDGSNGLQAFWGPEVHLKEAVLHLDLIDRNAAGSVPVAVIDGGFAGPAQYAPDPENPDFGPSFAAIQQGNCFTSNCTGSAGVRMTLPCAGGGPDCDWHGTNVFGVMAAVGDNDWGNMGV